MTRHAQDSETAPATGSRQRSNKALDAFLAAKVEIDAMLERLSSHSPDHFETSPDEIHWGHVGTLNHYRAKLRKITDSAFKEGEHADNMRTKVDYLPGRDM